MGGIGGTKLSERMKLCFIRYFILDFQDKAYAALPPNGQSCIRSVSPIPRVGAVGSRASRNCLEKVREKCNILNIQDQSGKKP
jgi:hypothetical protein